MLLSLVFPFFAMWHSLIFHLFSSCIILRGWTTTLNSQLGPNLPIQILFYAKYLGEKIREWMNELADLLWDLEQSRQKRAHLNYSPLFCSFILFFYQLFPYKEVQSILIVHGFHTCKFAYLLKFICNPQTNTHSPFSHSDMLREKNFEFENFFYWCEVASGGFHVHFPYNYREILFKRLLASCM